MLNKKNEMYFQNMGSLKPHSSLRGKKPRKPSAKTASGRKRKK
jgi:hypothetical protein